MKVKQKMILGLIPARGGSKGVKNKNIRMIQGKPLIAYAIECGLACPLIDHLIVSTDSPQIAKVANEYGAATPFMRPGELALDTSPMLPVMQHAIKESEKHYQKIVNCLILIDPTAPLRIPDDIDNALNLYIKNECDAVISGNSAHRNPYFNMIKIQKDYVRLVNQTDKPVGRRQDAPEVFDLNTVVWIYSRRAILEEKERIPKKTLFYHVPNERSIDLDTEDDFHLLEYHLNRKKYDITSIP